MLKVNSHNIHDSWEELNQEQFTYLVSLMLQHNTGAIDADNLRTLLACHLLGLSDRFVRRATKKDVFNENIYRIANQLRFMFIYEYQNQKSFKRIPKETRNALLRYHPDELGDSTHVRWARKAKRTMRPDMVFAKQLVPVIRKRRMKLTGYTFNLDSNVLTTSLTAEQFADALTLYNQFINNGDEQLANKLLGVLYCENYDTQKAIDIANNVAWVPMATKYAVVYNFMAIQTFLFTQTKYKVLFNTTGDKPSKNKQGFSACIYTMVRKQYGDLETVGSTNLVKFLEAMYNDLVSTIEGLKASGMELTKIAEQTGLSINTINSIT